MVSTEFHPYKMVSTEPHTYNKVSAWNLQARKIRNSYTYTV